MDILGVRSLPFFARRNYYYEFLHLAPWGVLAGLIEGNAGAIVVAKTFHGSEFLIATATATPIGTLLFSSVWGMLCVGRPKRQLATIFAGASALCAATIGFTPQTRYGGILFVIQMAASQVFLSGVVTVRSSLWKHNYPPHTRGKITARLHALRMLAGTAVLAVSSAMFDLNPAFYRFIYPFGAFCGLAAILILQKIHVRHEASELRGRFVIDDDAGGHALERFTFRHVMSPTHVWTEMAGLLRQDKRFTRYLTAQMLLGIGVQMVLPVLVITLTDVFRRYWITFVIVEVMRRLVVFVSLRRWGRLFDRVPVSRFRVYAGTCASIGIFCGLIATFIATHLDWFGPNLGVPLAAGLFAGYSVFNGLQQGGGTLAWNLGHFDFSQRHNAELYMAAHVSLTGLRGVFAPYLGVILLHLFPGYDWAVWLFGLLFTVTSTIAYARLAREFTPETRTV